MKRIRSNLTRTVLHNKWNDVETEFNAEEVHHDLTSDGIQSHEIRHLVALSCGHYAEPSGLCSACERAVCKECLVSCASCAKPIGKCHAVEGDDGKWRCSACSAEKRRAALLRLFLSPFIRFRDE